MTTNADEWFFTLPERLSEAAKIPEQPQQPKSNETTVSLNLPIDAAMSLLPNESNINETLTALCTLQRAVSDYENKIQNLREQTQALSEAALNINSDINDMLTAKTIIDISKIVVRLAERLSPTRVDTRAFEEKFKKMHNQYQSISTTNQKFKTFIRHAATVESTDEIPALLRIIMREIPSFQQFLPAFDKVIHDSRTFPALVTPTPNQPERQQGEMPLNGSELEKRVEELVKTQLEKLMAPVTATPDQPERQQGGSTLEDSELEKRDAEPVKTQLGKLTAPNTQSSQPKNNLPVVQHLDTFSGENSGFGAEIDEEESPVRDSTSVPEEVVCLSDDEESPDNIVREDLKRKRADDGVESAEEPTPRKKMGRPKKSLRGRAARKAKEAKAAAEGRVLPPATPYVKKRPQKTVEQQLSNVAVRRSTRDVSGSSGL